MMGALIDGNNTALRAMQSELADGVNIVQTVHGLVSLLKDEKLDQANALRELAKGTSALRSG